MEKFKIPIIVVAVLAVVIAAVVLLKGNGGSAIGEPTSNVDKAASEVQSSNRSGDPEVPESLRTGQSMGGKR